MRIAVSTKDVYLFQKIYLALREDHSVKKVENGEADIFDLCLYEGERPEFGATARYVRMSRSGEGDLTVPFSFSELEAAIGGESGNEIRSVRLRHTPSSNRR